MNARVKRSIFPLCLLLFAGCSEPRVEGNGNPREEKRHLGAGTFSRIEIDAPVDARVTVGPAAGLAITGDANLLRYVRSDIRDNTLHIYADEHVDMNLRKNMTAVITLPMLDDFDASGAGAHEISGPIRSEEFGLELSGSGSLTISELQAKNFSAEFSGSSAFHLLGGAIEHAKYLVSGSGEIRAFGATHQDARLELSGAANAEITVNRKLDVEISGAGTVHYKGHPAITKEISGSGDIRDAN